MLDKMREILDALPDPGPPRRLHVGQAIADWLRTRPAPSDPGLHALIGIPIILDPDLGRGQWQMRSGEDVVASGQVGDGNRVWYAPGQGFITLNDEAAGDALFGHGGTIT